MNVYLQCLIDFFAIFTVIFIIYKVFINRKKEDYENLKKSSEVRLVVKRYDLNMKKIKYKKLLDAIAVANSFIIAFSAVIVMNIKGILLAILVGLVTIMMVTYSVYEIVGRYFKKKSEKEK